ncbi:hypothetical protein AGMMS50230_22680 [Spirochaetia bacterium]|nr:hypothetical protein AGMMS50230_22680 [Spirochaetia bacterium]
MESQGMVVHPGAGNHSGTLANALLWRRLFMSGQTSAGITPACRSSGVSVLWPERTGIVHRLDKDTSGVIIAAYDDESLAFLSAQFKARTVQKRYLALVEGIPPQSKGEVRTMLKRDPRDRKCFTALPFPDLGSKTYGRDSKIQGPGKVSLTRYQVLRSWGAYSLVLLTPRTGRTHQLRVHLKYLGCPILGDPLYGRPDRHFPALTLMLHAHRLSIVLPGQKSPSSFKAPVPDRFKNFIRSFDSEK